MTGYGQPSWRATHSAATANSLAIQVHMKVNNLSQATLLSESCQQIQSAFGALHLPTKPPHCYTRLSCYQKQWLYANVTWACAAQALLDAGANLVGKTHLDELAYSLNGENMHYGTPVNPACPDRIPGGSSSGSAVRCCIAMFCIVLLHLSQLVLASMQLHTMFISPHTWLALLIGDRS